MLRFWILDLKIQTSLGWDFARDCRSDRKVLCEWVQTTDEGFSRPLILSIHLSASKFANLDVTASRKSEIFDRFCASGWSGHRDRQPLTESQSSSSILATDTILFVAEEKNKSVLLQTDRHFLLNFFWWVGGGSRSAAHDRGHFGRNLGVDKTKAKQVPMCTPTRFSLVLLTFSLLFVKKGLFYLEIGCCWVRQRCKNELEEWGWGCQICGSPDGDQKVFVAKHQKVIALADIVAWWTG